MKEEFFKATIADMPIAYSYNKLIFDKDNNPIDYEFIYNNNLAKEYIFDGNPNTSGMKFSDIISKNNIFSFEWLLLCGEVVNGNLTKDIRNYPFNNNQKISLKIWSTDNMHFHMIMMKATEELKRLDDVEEALYGLNDIVFVLNKNNIFEKVLTEKDELLFLPKEQIYGRHISEIFDDRMTKLFEEAIKNAQLTNDIQNIIYQLTNGHVKTYSAKIKYMEDGINKKYIIGISDITK